MTAIDETTSAVTSSEAADEAPQKTRVARLIEEVKNHPFGYSVLVVFVLAGPIAAPLIFPEAPPAVAAVGGLVFGAYAALCTVPQKFM